MARKTNMKHKALSVSEKLGIIKKVVTQPHVMHTEFAEQLSIPVSILNNIMANKKNIPQQCVTIQRGGKNKIKQFVMMVH
jgi:plasmid maintenance system antidote protein VapI